MARLNLANPTVLRGRHRATKTTAGATKNHITGSVKPERVTKSSTEFTIFEDEVPEHVDHVDQATESLSKATTRNIRQPLPLKLAHVNSITIGLSRASHVGSLAGEESEEEYSDKENLFVEEEAEEAPEEEDEDQHEEEELDGFTEYVNFNTPDSTVRKNLRKSQFGGYREPSPEEASDSAVEGESDDDGFDSLDDFIVSDSENISYHESADELPDDDKEPNDLVITEPSPKPARRRLLRGRKPRHSLGTRAGNTETNDKDPFIDTSNESSYAESPSIDSSTNILSTFPRLSIKNQEDDDPTEKTRKYQKSPLREVTVSRAVTSDSPTKNLQTQRLETPPPSPSKVPLPSPSKTNCRIPPSPHRESSDAFWSQEITNSWHEQWSPQKPRTPGRALQRLLVALGEDVVDDDDNEATSRPSSPIGQKAMKSPSKTALKRAEIARKKEVMAQKKAFDDKKSGLGEDFLKALDGAVCDGQVQKMTEDTGGIKTIWSKTLQTTAGRANWKQEKIVQAGQPTRSVHHASIELAERIIDSEDRLLNTLAHEYCHLANFIISKVTNNPHGPSFKEWGRKCTEAVRRHPIYKHYPVEVTTKHSYKIDYKYVWVCVDCGKDYGRHSKSIDPSKSKCGVCKGCLHQIKPKPRNVSPKKRTCNESSENGIENVTRAVGRVSLAPI